MIFFPLNTFKHAILDFSSKHLIICKPFWKLTYGSVSGPLVHEMFTLSRLIFINIDKTLVHNSIKCTDKNEKILGIVS